MDRLRVDGLSWRCIVGVLPGERVKEQTLTASVELELDVTAAALRGDLAMSVDYARLEGELGQILKVGKFRLIETAALALCHWLLAPGTAPVVAATVTLSKPEALQGRGLPSLSVRREASQARPRAEAGRELVFSSPDARVYRVPKQALPQVEPSNR